MAREKKEHEFNLANGKTPPTWEVKIKDLMFPNHAEEGSPLRQVRYVKGQESYFLRDQIGDVQESEPPVFIDGVLKVNKADVMTYNFIKNHPHHNRLWYEKNPSLEADKELDQFDALEEALERVNTTSSEKLYAIAAVFFGYDIIQDDEKIVKAKLKRLAYDDPNMVNEHMSAENWDKRFLASLALYKGVLKVDATHTEVQWAEGQTLLRIPQGKDAMSVLTEYLSINDDTTNATLSEIGRKVNPETSKKEVFDPSAEEEELLKLRVEYKKVTGKNVPNQYKNNADWLSEKINATEEVL